MWAICIKRAKSIHHSGEFLEIGEAYRILDEDPIGYLLDGYGWVIKECLSIDKYRESQLNKIINDTSLEM